MDFLTETLATGLAARAALVDYELENPVVRKAQQPDCPECGGSKSHPAWISLTERCEALVHPGNRRAEDVPTGAHVIIKGVTYTVADRYITASTDVAIRLADQAHGFHAGDLLIMPQGTIVHTF